MREWLLFLGEVRLGRLVAGPSDYPWFDGTFFPEPAFAPLEPLFAEASRRLRDRDYEGFDKVWRGQLGCDDLLAHPTGNERVWRVVMIHFYPEGKARWRLGGWDTERG
jgi:hypothetical protein